MRDSGEPQVECFCSDSSSPHSFRTLRALPGTKKADPEWTSLAQEPFGSDQIRSNFAGEYRKPVPFIRVSIAPAPITCSHTVSHWVTVPGT